MKKVLSLLLPLFVLSLMLMSSRCKRECDDISNPDCPNYDPCFKKLNADFKMGVLVEVGEKRYFELDTIIAGSDAIFEAIDTLDVDYEWKIGDDPTVFKTRRVNLEFPNPTRLTVRLITRHKSNCNSNLADTVEKRLVVIPKTDNYITRLFGYYQGAYKSSPKDTFTVRLGYNKFRTFLIIDNILVGCKDLRDDFIDYHRELNAGTYKNFHVGDAYPHFSNTTNYLPCVALEGWLSINKDESILTFDFKYKDKNTGVIKNEIFIGKKQ